jgi:hypothetical protein
VNCEPAGRRTDDVSPIGWDSDGDVRLIRVCVDGGHDAGQEAHVVAGCVGRRRVDRGGVEQGLPGTTTAFGVRSSWL